MKYDHAIQGFKLIEYVRDQFCTTKRAGLESLELTVWSRAGEPEIFERIEEVDLESLGRAFQRANLVDLLWDLSQSFDRGLALCGETVSSWKPLRDGDGKLVGRDPRLVPANRRVTYRQAESLYYYYLDELHTASISRE